jgi:N-carbamoylputrescine amidase
MQDIRVAAITCEAPVGEIDGNLTRTVEWTRQAKTAGADLVCFPELNITGYCNQPQMATIAQNIPGRVSDTLRDLAVAEKIAILAGLAEKNEHGNPFASHCFCSPEGEVRIYRKIHIAPPEKETYTAGENATVFSFKGVTFGIQLCYDAHFPELSSLMTARGAEIILFPHASPRGNPEEKHTSWLRHLTARAFDNSIFVIACNQVGENCNGLEFPGNALAIAPSGEVMAKDTTPHPSMLVVDLSAAELEAVRNHPMRHFFPHRRPEVYH